MKKIFYSCLVFISVLGFYNNVLAASPDLVVSGVSFDNKVSKENMIGGDQDIPVYLVNPNGSLVVYVNIKNIGDTGTDSQFETYLYYYDNNTNSYVKDFDTEITYKGVSIMPNSEVRLNTNWSRFDIEKINKIRVCVDNKKLITAGSDVYKIGRISESNESNNCKDFNFDFRDIGKENPLAVKGSLNAYLYPEELRVNLENRDQSNFYNNMVEYGFCLGVASSPTDCKYVGEGDIHNKIFESDFNVKENTEYYFRAYQKLSKITDPQRPMIIGFTDDSKFTMPSKITQSDLVVSDPIRVDFNGNKIKEDDLLYKKGIINKPVYFKVNIKNIGSGSTFYSPSVSIPRSPVPLHPEGVIKGPSTTKKIGSSLNSGESKDIIIQTSFDQCKTYFYKACADDNSLNNKSARVFGMSYYITEKNENNNCSLEPLAENMITIEGCCPSGQKMQNGSCVSDISPSGSIFAFPSSCTIKDGESTCPISLSWTTKDLIIGKSVEVTKNNPENTLVSTKVSGSNVVNNINFGSTKFFLYHDNGKELASTGEVVASCGVNSTWDILSSKCKSNNIPSGTLSVVPCSILLGKSSCNVYINWITKNLIPDKETAVTTDRPNFNTIISKMTSANNFSYEIDRGQSIFYLYHNSNLIALPVLVEADCVAGTIWKDSKCISNVVIPSTPSDLNLDVTYKDESIRKDHVTTKIPYNSIVKVIWSSPSSNYCILSSETSINKNNNIVSNVNNKINPYLSGGLKRDITYTVICKEYDGSEKSDYVKVLVSPINTNYIES